LIKLIVFGLLVGVLASGSGLGGGFLVVPLLIFLGKEAKMAVGTSFLFVFMVAVSGLLAHIRLGNVDVRTGVILALGGIVGAQLGPLLLAQVSDASFKRGFALLLVGTAVWLFANAR
jgi:uncharacterized membrane protein YfcA